MVGAFGTEEYGFVFLDRVDTEGREDLGGEDVNVKAGLPETLYIAGFCVDTYMIFLAV